MEAVSTPGFHCLILHRNGMVYPIVGIWGVVYELDEKLLIMPKGCRYILKNENEINAMKYWQQYGCSTTELANKYSLTISRATACINEGMKALGVRVRADKYLQEAKENEHPFSEII